MKKIVFIRLVFVVITTLLAILIFREIAIDSCLDIGGRFDYATRNCETPPDVEYVQLLDRDVWYRPVLFAGLVPAIVMFLLYKILIRFLPTEDTNE